MQSSRWHPAARAIRSRLRGDGRKVRQGNEESSAALEDRFRRDQESRRRQGARHNQRKRERLLQTVPDKNGLVQTNRRADQVEDYEARVAALALGPQDMNPIYIFLEQTTEMQHRALDDAAKDARARAQLAAMAAGAHLGGRLVVQEGNDSCMGAGPADNWPAFLAATTTATTRAIRMPRRRHLPRRQWLQDRPGGSKSRSRSATLRGSTCRAMRVRRRCGQASAWSGRC